MWCRWALLLAALLLTASITGGQDVEDDLADEEEEDREDVVSRAFLILRKSIKEKELVVGHNVTVVVEVYNSGDSIAADAEVRDSEWLTPAFETYGHMGATFSRVAPGSTVKFEYGLVPREAGYYTAKPAMARYRPDADQGATQGAYATGGMLTTPEHWKNGFYAMLALGGLSGAFWVYTAWQDASKKVNYRKALEEVTKYN